MFPGQSEKSSGYWAESVSGDGQGETLEIRLRKPGRLLGIMLETGISPVTDPERIRKPGGTRILPTPCSAAPKAFR